jgi:hypothetical protein
LVNSELIEPKSKMLERILTRNVRKLKGFIIYKCEVGRY